jgi:xanthine dehydrogenase accessory factor
MKNKHVWQFVFDCLQKEIPVILLAVVESAGASPGKAGFKMAIAANGERCGTIGGGIMEVNWVEQSRQWLRSGNVPLAVRKIFHSREAKHEQSGLICSGSQTMLTLPLGESAKRWVREILSTYEQKKYARLEISPNGMLFEPNQLYDEEYALSFRRENEWSYKENLGVLDTVYIVGSGHVGLALSRVMSTLDFRVVTIDDRAAVETFAKNTFAHDKIVSTYDAVGDIIRDGSRSYVAVVTTAYKCDEAALKSIINKNLKYVGLMGSDAKTEQIFGDLRTEGISDEQLRRIHTPIGLQIASHTPEEIAVSIAAEIIKVKNGST